MPCDVQGSGISNAFNFSSALLQALAIDKGTPLPSICARLCQHIAAVSLPLCQKRTGAETCTSPVVKLASATRLGLRREEPTSQERVSLSGEVRVQWSEKLLCPSPEGILFRINAISWSLRVRRGATLTIIVFRALF